MTEIAPRISPGRMIVIEIALRISPCRLIGKSVGANHRVVDVSLRGATPMLPMREITLFWIVKVGACHIEGAMMFPNLHEHEGAWCTSGS